MGVALPRCPPSGDRSGCNNWVGLNAAFDEPSVIQAMMDKRLGFRPCAAVSESAQSANGPRSQGCASAAARRAPAPGLARTLSA